MGKYFLIYGGTIALSLACLANAGFGAGLVPIGIVTFLHGVLILVFKES